MSRRQLVTLRDVNLDAAAEVRRILARYRNFQPGRRMTRATYIAAFAQLVYMMNQMAPLVPIADARLQEMWRHTMENIQNLATLSYGRISQARDWVQASAEQATALLEMFLPGEPPQQRLRLESERKEDDQMQIQLDAPTTRAFRPIRLVPSYSISLDRRVRRLPLIRLMRRIKPRRVQKFSRYGMGYPAQTTL